MRVGMSRIDNGTGINKINTHHYFLPCLHKGNTISTFTFEHRLWQQMAAEKSNINV